MADRDKREGRSWSLVFEDQTPRHPGDDTDHHRLPHEHEHENATVIDGDLAQQVEAELRSLRLEHTLEDDPRLQSVMLAERPAILPDNAAELTVRAEAPLFLQAITALAEAETNPPDADRERGTEGSGEVEAPPRTQANGEPTRVAPVPYELLMEPVKPEMEARPRFEITRHPPLPPLAEPRSMVPALPLSPAERTMIDLAAALGIAPEKPPPEPVPERLPASAILADPLPRELDDLVKVPRPKAQDPANRSPKAAPKAPNDKMDANRLQELVTASDSLARIIPVALAIFVVLATVITSAIMLGGRTPKQQHVELRFLSSSRNAPAFSPSDASTRVIVETTPPGLLVVMNREILGKTPVEVDLPLRFEPRVGVELSGPYFERWVGEVTRGPDGEYRIVVDLKRKQ